MRPSILRPHTQEILARYESGESTVGLARAYGVSVASIRKFLTKHAIPIRGPVPAAENPCIDCGGKVTHPKSRRCLTCFKASRETPERRRRKQARICEQDQCASLLTRLQGRYCSPHCRNLGEGAKRYGKILTDHQKRVRQIKRAEIWNDDQIEFLRLNYPQEGASWVAERMNKTLSSVRGKANRLKIPLLPEARRRLVHDAASRHMVENNPSKTPQGRERIREFHRTDKGRSAFAKLCEGRARLDRTKPSGLEVALRQMLDRLGVAYEPSWECKPGLCVDIRIGLLIIQADGDYWHGHPRFEPLTDRMKKQQARDRSHDKYLQARGFAVERFWECDLSIAMVREILDRHSAILGDQPTYKKSNTCNSQSKAGYPAAG